MLPKSQLRKIAQKIKLTRRNDKLENFKGVYFSDESFELFLAWVQEMTEQKSEYSVDSDCIDDTKAVDALVKEYFKRTDRPSLAKDPAEDTNSTRYDMSVVATSVANFMKLIPGKKWTSELINEELKKRGFNYDTRAITPVMRGVIAKCPNIKHVATGTYIWANEEGEE